MSTVAQLENKKRPLQVRVSARAFRRLKFAAAMRERYPGDIVSDLLIEHLPPAPEERHDVSIDAPAA